ncbi:PREDICTED: dnaJ homolog subfamily C member 18-like [Camelina sativa]|uniref:DnaJ homolog subfamily C member 18-like n=1 Tax=Camelina sativa TaxID=90675 RepID=A0ABM1QNG1_CAMSA|nr:PREDICTED: dnaJ homolog subfamily C member 18-like [Camelina sativa]
MESNEEEAKIAMDTAEKKLSENDYNGAKINGEADWYGILGVDPLADDEAMKKQYKKLALLLHPDKNRFNGAEGAFKLVLQAWDLLSDKDKRAAYDRKRKRKRSRMQDPPKPHEYESRYKSDPEPEQPDPDSSWEQENPREPRKSFSFGQYAKTRRATHIVNL